METVVNIRNVLKPLALWLLTFFSYSYVIQMTAT